MSRRSIALIVICLAVLIGVLVSVVSGRQRDAELSALAACGAKADIIRCAQPHIHKLLTEVDSKEILQDFETRKLPAYQCHYLGHVLGQAVYDKYQNVETAFGHCSASCNGACEHGVIGEAIKKKLGESDPAILYDVTPEQLLASAKSFCTVHSSSTRLTLGGICHGVGHAAYMTLKDIHSATDVCRAVATGNTRSDCLRGVYMEFSDVLSVKSAWQDRYKPEPFLKVSDLPNLCAKVPQDEIFPCYNYFPVAAAATYAQSGSKMSRKEVLDNVKQICLSAHSPVRRQECLVGYGRSYWDEANRDPSVGGKVCAAFDSEQDSTACSAGLLSLTVEYSRFETGLAYCASLATESLRHACYRAFFEKVSVFHPSVDKAEAFCDESQPSCKSSAEEGRRGVLHKFF